MTNLIRHTHEFKYHGDSFLASDLSVEEYILFFEDFDGFLERKLLEFNKEKPKLNQRQILSFIAILFGEKITKKGLLDQILENRERVKNTKKKIEDPLLDFHIFEGQVMSALHQPLSEIRKWNYKYFMDVYIDLQICVREKEYSRYRRSDKPDKANFRKEFKNNFS